jgi:hypothetical protein
MFQPVFLFVHTEIQSFAIASWPSRVPGSQSVVFDIFPPNVFFHVFALIHADPAPGQVVFANE